MRTYPLEALVPLSSGDRSANPATSCASGCSGLRQAHIPRSTQKRSGLGMPAPSEEGFGTVSADASCRFTASVRRSDCTNTYVSGSSVRPSIITPHFHEMRRCNPGASSPSGYSHYELHRRLVDSSSVASVGSSASRCCSCPHEKIGVTAKRQEKFAFSITEDHFPGRDMGLNVDAGAPATGTYRVHPID